MTPLYEPRLSWHAIERFRERILDIEPGKVEALLMTDEVKRALALGITRFVLGEVVLVADSGVIVTVMTKHEDRRNAPMKRKSGNIGSKASKGQRKRTKWR